MFILNLYKTNKNDAVYCRIRKNGSSVAIARVPMENAYGWFESSGSTVVHLDPGDKVYVGDCINPSSINLNTSFIGFLLQAD